MIVYRNFNTDNSTDTKKAIISDLNIFVLKKDNTACTVFHIMEKIQIQ